MKIKGTVISARRDFVKEHFGEDAWMKVVSAMPPEDQAKIKDTIMSSTWYTFEIGNRIDKAIVQVLGKGKESFFEELGAESARRILTKEHKTFITNSDPQAFMKKAGMIYKFYYDTGYREYKETSPLSGIITTYDSDTFSTPDCLTVIGWYKEALKMCGANNVTAVEEECRAKGGSCCRYRFEWKI
jgi:hypothetical protein